MLRDVFYYGNKPNIHPREKFVNSFEEAKSQSTTEHFWIINEFCDYRNFDWDFDFDFLPDEDVWTSEHINIWPSQHQKDSGTWLCHKECSDVKVYRTDVAPIKRKKELTSHWVLNENIDKTKFDFSWHPDPTDPPYIYKWGCKFFPVEVKHVLEYHVEGATNTKYMGIVELLPDDNWVEIQEIDKNKFDLSWRPDPREPAYIYVWGNKHIDGTLKSTLEYHTPGATEIKYMSQLLEVIPENDRWAVYDKVKDFDFTWRPDPREPAYIYVWGNKWISGQIKPTITYTCPGATQVKYMFNDVELLPDDNWVEIQKIDRTKFDLSFRPDPTSPPYIYVWGNKYIPGELQSTIEYRVPGATDKKYMSNDVEVLPETDRWVEVQLIDKNNFDMSWRPDPREPAYIYVWGNKWIPGEIKSTLEYHCPGAIEYKYMDELLDVLPETEKWNIVQDVDNFDMSWRPDPREPAFIYVWGNKWIPGESEPTLEYHCEGATDRKYMGEVSVSVQKDRWNIVTPIDETKFDLSWRPDPREPAYIYVWGNKYVPGEVKPTLEYYTPGATEKKYVGDVDVLPEWEKYKILIPIDKSTFDFTWRPDPREPAFIYVWGNEYNSAEKEPTIEYYCEGATERKYMHDRVVKPLPISENWKILIPIEDFDFSWRPDPHSPPYIYVFGNQWYNAVTDPTLEYHVPGATDKKYMDIVARVASDPSKWKQLIPVEKFDYSWRPDPNSPPYIYVFGNKWNDSTTEPSLEYHVDGAVDYKYMTAPVAMPKVEFKYWQINNKDDLDTFDFSWRPNPFSPPQIYQWEDNGPCYTVPGATDVVLMKREIAERKIVNKYKITTTLEDLINEHSDEVFWAINPDLNYDKFDFSWRPTEENFRHINVFGNEYSKNTQTYYINGPMYMLGHREYNYVEDQTVPIDSSSLDMFFVDRYNNKSQERYEKLKEKYPQIQKTRYLNTWVDTINRCIAKSKTKFFWVLSSELDYSEFKFDFYPSPWQEKMVHVFGTQWSHWGNTYLINKESFPSETKYVKIIEHLSVLNFVKNKKAKAVDVLYDIIHIDHGNIEDTANKLVVKYNGNYLTTFKDMLMMLPNKKEHYVWVVSSICDYGDFDFTYICDPFARDQLHVFPSNNQKFGDTFLVDVNKLRDLINKMQSLEDYEKVNFNQHQRVNRLPAPVIISDDTHTSSLTDDYNFPYAIYVTKDNERLAKVKDIEPISMWKDVKDIMITSNGGTRLIVPKEAKQYVKKELYDYPFIKTSSKLTESKPLDIVFFSNGEVGADENYEHLLFLTADKGNRVVRVDGVQGRAASQHAAAKSSETPWYFLVNAKLRVNKNFDFSWQPDRLQIPKHYIFLATNPVNGLEYGHQAIVANNKTLTLNTVVKGLDFTMDSEHEVVNMNSGVGMYNTSEWDTWRTAFREVIKLRNSESAESKGRLDAWLNIANGNFAEYSLMGAKDAIEFYESVNGDFGKLKLSYDWAWLKLRFDSKYK